MYYIQARFYMELTGASQFFFVVLETTEPFMAGIYALDINTLDFAKDEILRAYDILDNIDKYKQPVYRVDNSDEIITLTLPTYTYYRKGVKL